MRLAILIRAFQDLSECRPVFRSAHPEERRRSEQTEWPKKSSGANSSEGSNSEVLPLRQPPGLFKEEPKPEEPTGTARKLEWVELLTTPRQVPIGFSGPSGVANWEGQEGDDFVPEPDRWRSGFPDWDRYGPDHHVLCPNDPFEEDAPYAKGSILNPFRQNVLKGDYPIIGQHTFLNITAESFSDFEARQVPTPTTPFESAARPFRRKSSSAIRSVLHCAELQPVVRPVPRRRGVQAGRLANQDHADLQRQLPGRRRAGRRQSRTCERRHARGFAPMRRSKNGSSRRSSPT